MRASTTVSNGEAVDVLKECVEECRPCLRLSLSNILYSSALYLVFLLVKDSACEKRCSALLWAGHSERVRHGAQVWR